MNNNKKVTIFDCEPGDEVSGYPWKDWVIITYIDKDGDFNTDQDEKGQTLGYWDGSFVGWEFRKNITWILEI